ncbi:LacI family DNA-binding transcriptional regulator [uncultured Leifsonia sp.]|uniref:LacI family DNA-binding transcriptional regulator n=1 Tax=uncultured Leifsonia sp. TaxID=340359 RepID=UPI0028D68DCB|nr:LacI family DNA-binding transcriptional regulator [uncultured Leifsonia sp.]
MGAQPTVSDVAVAAGVSRQTVSNVLNSPGIVRPETRERVEAAIRSLGYRPHASARRLRTQKSSTIGIRLDPLTRDGISGSVLDRFLHALTEQADALGLRVLLFTARDPEDEIEQFRRLSDAADVDAFVLTSTFHGDPRTEWLIEHGQSFVTFGRPWGIDDMADPEHLWVDVDGRAGLRAATEHLLATGRERIGFLGWPAGSGTGDDRRAGWLEAMRAAGTVPEDELAALQEEAEDGVTPGADAMRRLSARFGGAVDAVVCVSDSLALGALTAAAGRLSVIGYDDTPVAASLGISSVEQPLDEVAAGVLDLLTGAHGGRVQPGAGVGDARHRLVVPHLVVRDGAPLTPPR